MTPRDYLQKAITIAGSQKKLAIACGISQTAIHKWLKRDAYIPLERAYQIDKATKGEVTKEQLRPDIYCDVAHDLPLPQPPEATNPPS